MRPTTLLTAIPLVLLACGGGKPPAEPPDAPTIALGPGAPTTEDDLLVTIVDGAPGARFTYQWVQDGVDRDDLDGDIVPAAETARDQRWEVFVRAVVDGEESDPASGDITVVNSPPRVTVAISPADPSGGDDLVATASPEDADGDAVTLRWEWTRDGEPADVVTARVPAEATAGGEVWSVRVTPSDGDVEGLPADDSVGVGNVAPELTSVRIEPADPRAGDTVTAVVDAEDLDGDDLAIDVVWTIDGAVAGGGETLSLVGAVRGEQVVATATVSDGALTTPEVASDPVTIQNTPPTVASVTLEPLPLEDTPSECTPAGWSDADFDPEGYLWAWYVNDLEVTDTPRLNGTGYDKGDRVRCEATPFDGFDAGPTVSSDEVVVGNTPPRVAEGRIVPDPATSGDVLEVVDLLVADDDDDPVELTLNWSIDGVPVHTGDTLDPAFTRRGQLVSVEVVPWDGDDLGDPVVVGPVAIANGLPSGAVPAIVPAEPRWGVDDLRCVLAAPAMDPDGDPVSYRAVWRADGELMPGVDGDLPADTMPAAATVDGRTWSCAWIAGDPTAEAPATDPFEVTPVAIGGNLLILLADDVGTDKVGAYREHPDPPPTPEIDALAAEGVLFRHAYAQPTCSPTRAAMLTGRFPIRFDLGKIIDSWQWAPSVPSTEIFLPQMLALSPDFAYDTSLAGKWHMGTRADGLDHPANEGWGWHAGSLGNLRDPGLLDDPRLQGYGLWEKNTNGALAMHEVYATTDTVDDVIARMHAMPEPWVIYVAFNAPHTPTHVPPADLHSYDIDEGADDHDKFQAMVEALDTEIGRLLDNIPAEAVDDTHIVFMGDNGTPAHATTAPFDPDKAKGSVWEGGIHVPLIVKSPLVTRPGSESDALVHAVDVYTTAAVMAGVDVRTLTTVDDFADEHPVVVDGQSLLPYVADASRQGTRSSIMVERFSPNGLPPYLIWSRAITDGRWKLIAAEAADAPPEDFLYDLADVPVEGVELLSAGPLSDEASEAYARLSAELAAETARRDTDEIPPLGPHLEGAVVEPEVTDRGDPITCIPLSARDPNWTTPTFRYEWWLDGELSDESGDTIAGDAIGEAVEVTCLVYASDGDFEVGPAVARAEVEEEVIADPHTPTVTAVLGPGGATEADVFTCYATDVSDPDGDDVELIYSWRVDLVDLPDYDAPTLDGTYFDRGDGIRCGIIATDGEHFSEKSLSNRIVVANFVPTTPEPTVVPADPAPGEAIRCALAAPIEDLDPGDEVTYAIAWTRDGVPFDGATTTFEDGDTVPDGVTSDGEAWQCTIVASDGLDDSLPGRRTAWVWDTPPDVWPTGLDEVPPNTVCLDPGRPASDAVAELVPAFALDFALDEPTWMTYPPGDDSYWYAILQDGLIVRWVNSPATSDWEVVLDFSEHVRNIGAEQGGALGLAFHPDFSLNGEVFVSYTAMGPDGPDDFYSSRLSRFTSFDGGRTIDPDSEEILLDIDHRYIYHNGGHVEFGPDGYLWFALGDGGGVYDPFGHGGDPHTLFSTIMRLDVDGGFPYAIPPDNPFADGIDGAPEVWAYGFRNPWRYHLDWETGDLWVGDVGANTREEISLVERGGHHGWATFEGTLCLADPCDDADMVPPVVEWEHVGSAAAIGGVVYRGSNLPDLYGMYLYTDYYGGTPLMGIERVGEDDFEVHRLIPSTGRRIASFSTDMDGEVYLIDHVGGIIWTLAPPAEDRPDEFPTRLSETGCVDPDDPTSTSPVMVPYGVQSQLWSDDAAKRRYFAIPDGTTVTVAPDGNMELPIGSVAKKDFILYDRLIETRLLIRHADGEWGGYSYRWLPDQSDAILVDEDGLEELIGDTLWYYPARGQCFTCHTEIAGRSLGVESLQLNGEWLYPNGRLANQIDTINHLALLDGAPPAEDLPAMPSSEDESASAEARARSYLHANCAFCHVDGGTGAGPADFHYLADDPNVCDVEPFGGDVGLGPDARLLAPGDPDASVILERMSSRGEWQMPPLGTFIVDPHGTDVVRQWILETDSCD